MKALTLIWFLLSLSIAMAQPDASRGRLDLREHDFTQGGLVPLRGEWEIYPNLILNPQEISGLGEMPSYYAGFRQDWSDIPQMQKGNPHFGHATYRLTLILPNGLPPMALKLHEVNTAYSLYVNGKLVERNGVVGTSQGSSKPYWRPSTKRVNLHAGANELVMQISNYHSFNGGPLKPILLGPETQVSFLKNLEIGGVLFLVGCLVVAGIFALGLFWFRPSDISGLLFMLFCLMYAYWILSADYHLLHSVFKDISWTASIRLEQISLSLAVILYTYFVKLIMDSYLRPAIFHVMAGASGLMLLISLFTPPSFFTMFIEYYYLFLASAFVLISILALQQFNFTHKLAWVNIVGIGSLMVVIGHKVLVLYDLSIEDPLIYIGGSVLFIFSQALVLAIRFGRNYREYSMAALAAARTRDEFLNTMSHELRTPMNAILGMATFLEKSHLDAQQKDKLSAIKRNGEALLSLITDVLSISEVGTGRLQLKSQVVNIESCVESAVSLSKQHLRTESVHFKVSLDSRIPPLVMGDSSRIKQILMHLLSNAFKYTEEGEVLLKIELKEIGETQTDIKFLVVDTGVGISQYDRNKIFDVFKQGQFGNTRKYGGVGLGLSVVHQLVTMMDGHLHVKSKKNEGTLVQFNIKLKNHVEHTEREVTSIFETNEVDTSLKILYAEDNPVNQKLLQMMLQQLGLKIDIAKNGREAVDMAMKKYYNIIFMDIQMPEMDGLEATKRIVENSTSRPIIIANTANLAEVDKRKCFDAGMNDFLNKPIQQDELKLAIIKWQGLKKYLDDSSDKSIKLSS